MMKLLWKDNNFLGQNSMNKIIRWLLMLAMAIRWIRRLKMSIRKKSHQATKI